MLPPFLVPGKMRWVDTNDAHVSLAHFHPDTLCETARQTGIAGFGELVPRAECSEAERRRIAVPRTTEASLHQAY